MYGELLKKVVENGDRLFLNKLLNDHDYDLNTVLNEEEETLFHLVCRNGHFNIVRTLIEVCHCNLKAVDIHGNSPFHTACANQQLKIALYICRNICFIPCKHLNHLGDTVLHVACKSGSVPMVRLIFCELFISRSNKMSFSWRHNMYEDEILPLLLCINDFSLLGSRFSVDGLYNSRGYTPIHEACSEGHLDVLKFFFAEVRLNLNLPSLLQCVPSLLGIACKLNHCNIIDYMHSLYATGIHTPMAMVFKEDATNKWTSAFVNHFNACIDNLGNFTDQWGVSRKIEGESSLIFAVRNANKILFEHICKKRPDFTCANYNGDTLLHAACLSYDLKMFTDIWKLSKWTDEKNKQGNTFFHLACEWGSLEIVEFLINTKSFKVDEKNSRGETSFHLSIIYEQFPIFERLLNMQNSSNFINAATNNGETPLHLATCDGKLSKYAQQILAHKKFDSINYSDNLGNTPLFNACYTREKELICLVMEYKGCDILHVNKHGETVFNVALRMNMSNLFFKKLAKSNLGVYPHKLQNRLGQTLLHIACSTGDLQTVKDLDDQKLYAMREDINLMDKVNELTPLQYACKECNEQLCKLLLKVTDCDPDTKNKEGDTALHICSKHNLVEMAKLCKEHSSITVRNELGDTPLHVACKHGNYELAQYLLESSRGKQLDDYYNAKGDTVLHVAAGKEDAVEVMKSIIGKKMCDYKATNVINGLTALHIAFSEGILENAEYLLSLHPQKDSWYTNDYRSPLCYAVENRCYDFLQLFTKSADSWFLENCIKVRHPFDNLLREEFITMPLPHYLLYTVIVTHKDARSQLYQEGHMRAVQGSHLSKCALLGDFLSSFLDDRAYKMYDSHECSLLHYFALCNCEYLDPLADKILQNCKIDHTDKYMQLPLHFACYKENELVIFKILEQQNAHELLHYKNLSELAPPAMCSKYSNDCTSFLLSWGAEIEFPPQPRPDYRESTSSIGIAVLGNSSVGKTTLIHALKKMLLDKRDIELESKPTTGIVTFDIKSVKKSGHIYTFHDFAGQTEFETSHSMRLENILTLASQSPASSPFIFLVVVKGSDPISNNKLQINRWVSFVCAHVTIDNRSVHIALVCTHDDQFKNDDVKKARYDELKAFLNGLDVKPLKMDIYELPILLNATKTDTSPIIKLLRYLEDKFFSSQPVKLSHACEAVHWFINQSFPDKPCQVKDLAAEIKQTHTFQLHSRKIVVSSTSQMLPHEKKKLVQILKQLHVHNCIVLFCHPSDILDWWIVNKQVQNIMFSKVSSIFSPDDFDDSPAHLSITHNTGVVPAQKLFEIFKEFPVPIDVVQEYLISMEYCKRIDDKDVLELITGSESSDKNEDHFFFPGLIRKEKEKGKLNGLESKKCFGWLLESKKELGLRFLHSLLLSLTFKFPQMSPSDNSKYKRRLHLWKNGLFWCTDQDINVLVEVIEDRNVVAIFQCSDEQLVPLAKYRSCVIAEIRKVLKCSKADDSTGSEYFLNYPSLNFNTVFSGDLLSTKIALQECVKDKQLGSCKLFVEDTVLVSIRDLLGFDSYILLELSTLRDLKEPPSTTLSNKTFGEVRSQLGAEVLAVILESSSSSVEKLKFKSTIAFCEKLEEYSIFPLEDVLCDHVCNNN